MRLVHILVLPALVTALLGTQPARPATGHPRVRPDAAATRAPSERTRPMLTVTTQGRTGVPKVSPGLVGANPRFLGDADGILTADGSTLNARTVTLMRRLGLRSLRYPGGTPANLFDYRRFDSDPATKPQCQVSGGFDRPVFSSIRRSFYGPGLNTQFTDDVDAATNLMLPMVDTTTDLAAGFVDTVRQGQQSTLYVEVGNEPYLDNQRYWRSSDPATRLTQYLEGGPATQPPYDGAYADNTSLFSVKGCGLRNPATADGTPDQVYRPRFWPVDVSADHPPTITVGDQTWTYVPSLVDQAPDAQVFTLSADRSQVQFGDGVHGAEPDGPMTIDYAVDGLGFDAFYQALHQPGVKVCASWGRVDFATLAGADHPYDCLTYHSYVLGTWLQNAALPTAYARLRDQVANRVAYERRLTAAIRAQGVGAAGRFLMVTEYGTLDPIPHQGAMHLNDLLLAQQMVGQVTAGVRVANISNFASLLATASDGTTYLSSRARLLQLIGDLAGQKPRVVDAVGAKDVQVLATREHGVTRMIVLNMRPGTGSYRPVLRIAGASRTRCVAVRRLSGALDASHEPLPTTGLPATAHLSGRTWRAGTSYYPHFFNHSVTSLTVRPKGARPCAAPGGW